MGPYWLSIFILSIIFAGSASEDSQLEAQLESVMKDAERSLHILEGRKLACSLKDPLNLAPPLDEPKPIDPTGVLDCKKSKSPLFKDSNTPLEITIQGELPTNHAGYLGPGGDDEAYWKNAEKATLSYQEGKKTHKFNIGLLKRAKSRASHCKFPPMKILWPEDEKAKRHGTLFDKIGSDEMKLVVHCDYTEGSYAGNEKFSDNVIKEHYVYQLSAAMGYTVPDTRLVKVKYLKPDGSLRVEGYGILIEPKSSMTKRCGGEPYKGFDIQGMNDLSSFIGFCMTELFATGSDYSISGKHNTIPMFKDGKMIGVAPYDFNDTYLVSARFEYTHAPNHKNVFQEIFDGRSKCNIYNSPKTPELYQKDVLNEMVRSLSRQEKVDKLLKESLIQDKTRFVEQQGKFFTALREFLVSKGVDVDARLAEIKAAEQKRAVGRQAKKAGEKLEEEEEEKVLVEKVADHELPKLVAAKHPAPLKEFAGKADPTKNFKIMSAKYKDRDVTARAQAQFKQDKRITGCGYGHEFDNFADLNFVVEYRCKNSKGIWKKQTVGLPCYYQYAFYDLACPD